MLARALALAAYGMECACLVAVASFIGFALGGFMVASLLSGPVP